MPAERASSFYVESTDGRSHNLIGVVDENADLSFFGQLAGHAKLNVKGVRRINSYGVRAWIEALRTIPPTTAYDFVECSPPLLDQPLPVAGFQGKGKVISFYAPMVCPACGHESDQLHDVSTVVRNAGRIPKIPCPDCGRTMELDDLEERYQPITRP
jgi:hypothetical protein